MLSKPRDIILFFFNSLVGFSKEKIEKMAIKEFLDDLPTLTQLIPSFGESVIFDRNYLINKDGKTISNIEFLIKKYKVEWENFYERMKKVYGERNIPSSPKELLKNYLVKLMIIE